MKRPDEPGLDTRAVHGPHVGAAGAMSTPIVHSVTFAFDTLDGMLAAQEAGSAGAFYQRNGHPTIHAVETRLAALEGAEDALLFPSGMGAISSAFLSRLKSGDHVVCVDPCYGGTQALLQWGKERFGWSHTFVDPRRPDGWASAFQPNTKLLHLECPINPTLACFDIAAAARLGHERGAFVTIDNTIATPLGQQPLALRVRAANANALERARRLTEHAGVAQVFYPGLPDHPGHAVAAKQMREGFGPLLSFEVRGGADAAMRVVNALGVIRHGASLGGVESLASLPAHTSHKMIGAEGRKRAGIPEGLVRLSAGIEGVDDLWADLDQALAKASVARV